MEEKKVYAVIAYGGEWEDKWESVECVCTTTERAQEYIDNSLKNRIPDDLFDEMEEYLANEEYKIQSEFYNTQTSELIDGKSEVDYEKAINDFEIETQYEIIKEKWGISRESFDKAKHDRIYGFDGYIIEDVPYFE